MRPETNVIIMLYDEISLGAVVAVLKDGHRFKREIHVCVTEWEENNITIFLKRRREKSAEGEIENKE